jgi:hypothetical protein
LNKHVDELIFWFVEGRDYDYQPFYLLDCWCFAMLRLALLRLNPSFHFYREAYRCVPPPPLSLCPAFDMTRLFMDSDPGFSLSMQLSWGKKLPRMVSP